MGGCGLDSKALRSSTAAKTNVNDTNISTTILASNTNRLGASVLNDSTVTLYLDLSGGYSQRHEPHRYNSRRGRITKCRLTTPASSLAFGHPMPAARRDVTEWT